MSGAFAFGAAFPEPDEAAASGALVSIRAGLSADSSSDPGASFGAASGAFPGSEDVPFFGVAALSLSGASFWSGTSAGSPGASLGSARSALLFALPGSLSVVEPSGETQIAFENSYEGGPRARAQAYS